ncbi:MAG: (Fe-S)-binding protein [Bacteroidetes bacterium]|nr:(Fe-S)-binding protein [Bacteroidota bacterium]
MEKAINKLVFSTVQTPDPGSAPRDGKFTRGEIEKGLKVFENGGGAKLFTHLNSCVHCGLCAESCIYYKTMGDDRYTPARKVDLVASVYRRYHTFAGKYMPLLVNARDLNEDTANEMVDLLFGACTMCGRCTMHCSIGVDIAYLVKTGRTMLSEMGMVPASLQSTVKAAVETGNNMGIPTPEFVDTLKWMEDELTDELNTKEALIPVDEKGKNVLYTLNPREPKFFPLSISAMAKIFYAAGESWTLSSNMYDITNYAYFSGNNEEARLIAKRMWDEMEALRCSTLVLAECGHGSRALRWESPNYLKKTFPFKVKTSVEIIADYLHDGKIKLDQEKFKEAVTLHDPCNLVRSGGICMEQRYILNEFIEDFREMTPHGIDNYCCGGGGRQLAMSEYNERRMKTAEVKAEQIRKTGAKVVVSPCHNCVDQLTQINFSFKLNVQIKTLAELVADAIIL